MAIEFSFTEPERLQMLYLRDSASALLQIQYNEFANLGLQDRYNSQEVIEKLKFIILQCDLYAEIYQLKNSNDEKTNYTVREGDTLKSIAHKFYNDHRKWTYLSYYNELTDSVVVVGTVLTIPELTEDQN